MGQIKDTENKLLVNTAVNMHRNQTINKSTLNVFIVLSCCYTHLKRISWLLVEDPDKYLPDYQLFAVISEQKLCSKAFIILSL